MRVLYVIPGAVFGGAHNQVLQLHKPLQDAGYESVVLMPDEPGDAYGRLVDGGVDVHTASLVRIRATLDARTQWRFCTRLPRQFGAYRRLFEELGADIVQAHGITQGDVVYTAKRMGLGTIWQLIDTRAPRPLRSAFRPLLRKLPDVVFAVGSQTLAAHVDPASLPEPAILYAPPPRQDLRVLGEAERADVRRRLGVGPDDVLVVSVGNFNPQKGHQHLIAAAAQIRDPRLKLRIQGSRSPVHPDYVADLQRQAAAAGLEDFRLEGWDPALGVPELLGAADVFVLASEPRSEGLPTVILEAMSVGLPVVASEVGSVADAVDEGVTGYLVPSQEPGILADRLRALAADAVRRAQFGAAGRSKFEREFTLDACIRANLAALERARDAMGPSRTMDR